MNHTISRSHVGSFEEEAVIGRHSQEQRRENGESSEEHLQDTGHSGGSLHCVCHVEPDPLPHI